VILTVAAPALPIGWPDLVMPDSFIPHLGAVLALPTAFAGLILGLAGGHNRRVESTIPVGDAS
jgi:hypothetical protein